ncbi:MAG: adenylate kinase family protein [Candidatus ainarchaeum sp.]|nr:adenylate kinase family protein [Candidatus ainarchaeum sp.]
MLIVVTGSPCTGKTTSSVKLGKILGMDVLHIRDFVRVRGLGGKFDKRMESELVDIRKLGRMLRVECRRRTNVIVEGHLACEVKLPADWVFVLRCGPDALEKRLRGRGYPEGKVEENLLAEMLDYCLQKSETNYSEAKIVQLETRDSTAAKTARKMMEFVGGKRTHGEKVNYTAHLIKHLGLENGRGQKKGN